MTDQQLLISTLRQAGRIIAEYLEPGASKAEETLSRLIAVLDNDAQPAPSSGLRKVTDCGS